jgi:hypothetical protein
MAWQAAEAMKQFLEASELCDSDSPAVREKATAIIQAAETPREAAERIFHFVRDQILFGFDRPGARASDTLRKRMGSCISKTNLQVALFRAAGIPARYHLAALTKEALKGVLPAFAYRSVPERIAFHPWCECYMSGKWISSEVLFDQGLYEALLRRGLISREQIPTIDWDGIHDLNTVAAWILEDVGTSACLDDVFREAQSHLPSGVSRLLINRHINALRKS